MAAQVRYRGDCCAPRLRTKGATFQMRSRMQGHAAYIFCLDASGFELRRVFEHMLMHAWTQKPSVDVPSSLR